MTEVINFMNSKKDIIYFDNAATSWPKPSQVLEAITKFMNEIGANPGRSGYQLSIEAARIIYEARESLAKLFNFNDPSRIIFTLNATESINLALKGLLKPNDHVITSSMEHNSVMRPLRQLEKHGIELSIIPCSSEGYLDPDDLKRRIKPNTKMIILNHASNVIGTILPIREVGQIAKKHNIIFLVDAAQAAGAYSIDVNRDSIDLLAFTGHKSLYGPQGTGGLVIGPRIKEDEMIPLKHGGTGSRSEFEEQPDFLPDRFESGTPNTVGIAGLLAGVRFVIEKGVDKIRQHEVKLTQKLIYGLKDFQKIHIYGSENIEERTSTISFNIEGLSPSNVAFRLEKEFGILSRAGLQCAPSAHRTIGTFPDGTVRFSLSYFNNEDQIEKGIEAIRDLIEK